MPATAGRVRMPANNRVHSSAALQTHGIWQVAIGYDPYAPANKDKESKPNSAAAIDNAYESFQGLLSLARITNANCNETRGACKKCGRVGHLTYQCRNFLSLKDEKSPEGDDSAVQTVKAVFEKIKKARAGGAKEEESEREEEEEDEEISSSDSDVDPEIERIIAERFGKPLSKKVATLSKGIKKKSNSSDDDEEEKRKKRKHRHKKSRRGHGRHGHHHRRSDSSDDGSDSDWLGEHKRRRRSRSGSSDRRGKRKERRSVLSSDSESTASSSDEDERRKRREKKRSKRHRSGEKI